MENETREQNVRGDVGMQGELSQEKVERKKAQKSAEVSMKSLKYTKDWEIIVERLIQALRDENKYMRWGAAGALGELGDARAVEALTEVLKDEDLNVREMAVWALKKIGNRAKMEPFIRVPRANEKDDFGEEGERRRCSEFNA